jgi:hypothetical protein
VVRCAILTRDALNQLLNDDPRTAAKLMMAISLRIAERMRESADKLKLYSPADPGHAGRNQFAGTYLMGRNHGVAEPGPVGAFEG